MDVRVNEVLLVVRMNSHQCALILRPTSGLSSLIVLQIIDILQTLLISIPRPPMRAGIFVLNCDVGALWRVSAARFVDRIISGYLNFAHLDLLTYSAKGTCD